MFSRAYKLKSNNTLKNSEKKHLVQRIADNFPADKGDKIKEILPVKSTITCMKLILCSGDTVSVYVVDNVPAIIETSDKLYPTVCALWKVPDLVPNITTNSMVLSKVQNGAPLFQPGVQIPANSAMFPAFPRGAVIYVNTDCNASAAAVGYAACSSADMIRAAGGWALVTVHIIGDFLCKENKFNRIERPKFGPPTYRSTDIAAVTADMNHLAIHQKQMDEEWPSLSGGPQRVENEPAIIPDDPTPAPMDEKIEDSLLEDPNTTIDEEALEDPIPTDMDELLKYCLLSFIRVQGKTVELPLKTNLLYRNHLIPLCPENRSLDVKKSTYKKMGKFLDAMQKEGLIEVKEIEKGVDALMSVSLSHPLVRQHVVSLPPPPSSGTPSQSSDYVPPVVRELYSVTAAVAPILSTRQGTTLTLAEIRAALGTLVRAQGLQQGGLLRLVPELTAVLGSNAKGTMKWEDVMTGIVKKMTPCTEMTFSDGTVSLVKTKLEPIKMQVQTRSGNKKVTLVWNLEWFGFRLPELAKLCQARAAASCCVTRPPSAKRDLLLLQGDQTHFIAKLLIEEYNLPKKFVEGADKALKKKAK